MKDTCSISFLTWYPKNSLHISDDAAFITGQAIVIDGGQYRIG